MRRVVMAVVAFGLWVQGAPALAHVEIRPESAVGGTLTAFTLTVPNERASAATVSVALQLSADFTDVTGTPQPGWSVTVTTDKVVRWQGGRITGQKTATFRFSARVPNAPGTSVAIPAIQTYSNGETDRWIERTDPERPAPVIAIAGDGGTGSARTGGGGGSAVWLAAGTLAALVALGALAWDRRRRAGATDPAQGAD